MIAVITYPTTAPQWADTTFITLQKLLQATIAGGGGGGGGTASQIVYYTTTDPNTDGVVPPDQTKAAIAVKPGATSFVWDSNLLTWDV